jgi:hypothetical protein
MNLLTLKASDSLAPLGGEGQGEGVSLQVQGFNARNTFGKFPPSWLAPRVGDLHG